MKKVTLLILIFFTINSFVFSQNYKYRRRVIDTLCSSHMYGRGFVNQGDRKAANFISKEFKSINLIDLTPNYQQKFPLNINTFKEKQFLKINENNQKIGRDYIVSPNSGTGKGNIKLISYDKFLKIKKVNKKGVILSSKEYKTITKDKYLFEKLLQSKIVVKINSKKLTASLAQYQLPIPVIDFFDTTDLKIKNIEYDIKSELIANYQTQNVIGMIKGTEIKDSFLIFCAHYDHLGGMGSIFFPGANDNAAGIAMLLEMAKHYKLNPPKYSIIFIAFGGEEAGLVGSKYFTENPLIELSKIKFLMNMDLVGTGEDGITVVNGKIFKNDFDRMLAINDSLKLLTQIKSRGKAANSDHYYFSEKGVPAFFIYAMGKPSHYHDINDDGSDLKLEKFDEIMKLIIEFMK